MPPAYQTPFVTSDSEEEPASPTRLAQDAIPQPSNPPPQKPYKKKHSVPGSDSGYSSISKASKTSSNSKGSTERTPRPYSSSKPPNSKTILAHVDGKAATSSSTKSSRTSSRAPSTLPSASLSCQDPNCQPKMQRHVQHPVSGNPLDGHWEHGPPPSPGLMISSSQPPYLSYPAPPQVLAPSAPHSGPPPPAVPRPRRISSVSQQRPMSVAAPGGSHMYSRPAPPTYPQPSNIPAHPMGPPTLMLGQPQNYFFSSGTWVNTDPGTSNHPPPQSARPVSTHRATDVPTARPLSIHYGSTPPTNQSDYGHTSMPPPMHSAPAGYPPRSSSRRPSHEAHARPQPLAHDSGSYFPPDPSYALAAPTEFSRQTVVAQSRTKSRSATYYRDPASRYSGGERVLERITPLPNLSRHEKTRNDLEQAAYYQDRRNDVGFDEDAFEDHVRNLQLEGPPSTHARRPSYSHHIGSYSRASGSIASNETGTMRLLMYGNRVEIGGEIDGRAITVNTGDDGKPQITIDAGPASPSKSREKRYVSEGSARSRGSFVAPAGMRIASRGSAREAHSATPSTVPQRRSVAGRRLSRDYHPD